MHVSTDWRPSELGTWFEGGCEFIRLLDDDVRLELKREHCLGPEDHERNVGDICTEPGAGWKFDLSVP